MVYRPSLVEMPQRLRVAAPWERQGPPWHENEEANGCVGVAFSFTISFSTATHDRSHGGGRWWCAVWLVIFVRGFGGRLHTAITVEGLAVYGLTLTTQNARSREAAGVLECSGHLRKAREKSGALSAAAAEEDQATKQRKQGAGGLWDDENTGDAALGGASNRSDIDRKVGVCGAEVIDTAETAPEA